MMITQSSNGSSSSTPRHQGEEYHSEYKGSHRQEGFKDLNVNKFLFSFDGETKMNVNESSSPSIHNNKLERFNSSSSSNSSSGNDSRFATEGYSYEKHCDFCGNSSISLLCCTRCKTSFYCGEYCQTRDWEMKHKDHCIERTAQEASSMLPQTRQVDCWGNSSSNSNNNSSSIHQYAIIQNQRESNLSYFTKEEMDDMLGNNANSTGTNTNGANIESKSYSTMQDLNELKSMLIDQRITINNQLDQLLLIERKGIDSDSMNVIQAIRKSIHDARAKKEEEKYPLAHDAELKGSVVLTKELDRVNKALDESVKENALLKSQILHTKSENAVKAETPHSAGAKRNLFLPYVEQNPIGQHQQQLQIEQKHPSFTNANANANAPLPNSYQLPSFLMNGVNDMADHYDNKHYQDHTHFQQPSNKNNNSSMYHDQGYMQGHGNQDMSMRGNRCMMCYANQCETQISPCLHVFCQHCIYQSLQYENPTCPCCMQRIESVQGNGYFERFELDSLTDTTNGLSVSNKKETNQATPMNYSAILKSKDSKPYSGVKVDSKLKNAVKPTQLKLQQQQPVRKEQPAADNGKNSPQGSKYSTSDSGSDEQGQPSGLGNHTIRWKSVICEDHKNGKCPFTKRDCHYAHGLSDIRAPPISKPALQKTIICEHWKSGKCRYKKEVCPFAHGEDDIKLL